MLPFIELKLLHDV